MEKFIFTVLQRKQNTQTDGWSVIKTVILVIGLEHGVYEKYFIKNRSIIYIKGPPTNFNDYSLESKKRQEKILLLYSIDLFERKAIIHYEKHLLWKPSKVFRHLQ